MPSTPTTSDTVLNASASADPGLRRPGGALELTAEATEKVSPPLALISEHEVLFGTAAAIAVTPSFEGELEAEDAVIGQQDVDAKSHETPKRSGWIATVARRVRTSRDGRPPRQHCPPRLGSEFIADARMDREMYRL
jgi:hypothetical protein